MFRKTTIIKRLIILLAVVTLATWGWTNWQIAKEKQITKEKQIVKEKQITKKGKEKQIPKKKETKKEKELPKIPEEFIPKQDISKITKIEEIHIEPFDVSTWNVYINEEYGFEIRYPKKGKVLVGKFQEFDVPSIFLDPEGDNDLPPREPLPPEPHFSWQEEFSWRSDDDIEVLIFSSFEKLRNGMMKWMREFESKELFEKANTLEELLEANVKNLRFDKQSYIYVRKMKIDDKIGYQFIDKFYFPTPINWKGKPNNYSIIFSPPNNKIYWFFIGNQLEDTPQMKLFFQILSTLRFLD